MRSAARIAVVLLVAGLAATALAAVHVSRAQPKQATAQAEPPAVVEAPTPRRGILLAAARAQARTAARELRSVRRQTSRIVAEQARLRAGVMRIRAAREARERRKAREARAARDRRRQQQSGEPRESGGLIVGDSVSLGAQRCLTPLGYRLDSEVGRQFPVGLQRIRAHAAAGLPQTVVVHLGTNGPFAADGFRAVMSSLGSQRRVVWVTIALPDSAKYSFRDSLNRMIRDLAAQYPNVRVADFADAAQRHPEWFYPDGVHINSAGCAGFADVVDAAVTASGRG